MSTPKLLVDLSNNGELGRLLAEKFKGEVGHTSGRKDADFLVVFQDEASTPGILKIGEAIKEHYGRLGFTVQDTDIGYGDQLSLLIHCNKSDPLDAFFSVTITTRYPHGGRINTLRATTYIVV